MGQQTRIASLLKEVDELRNRLTQAEEMELSQKKMNQKLKETFEIETSSLKETLLKSKQDGEMQTKRAESLENECNILKKRVDELEHEITRTEKGQVVQCKEITDTSCQTDDTISEVCVKQQEPVNGNDYSSLGINKGLRTSKAEAKESGRIHVVEEKEMTKIDSTLTEMTKSSTPVTKVTENVSQIEEQQSHQPEKQQKVDAEEVLDNTTGKNVSENSVTLGATIVTDQENKSTPATSLPKDNSLGEQAESRAAHILNNECETKNRDTSKNVDIGMANENGATLQIPQETVEEGIAHAEKNLKEAILSQNNQSVKETNASKIAVKDSENKENQLVKKVTFELEETINTASKDEVAEKQLVRRKKELKKDNFQLTFSDDEKDEKIDQDVSQRISRIQNLLRNDRLRTNRKRKYPVV